MSAGVAFQTRARTIDHLGRGQIADSPTAISELWKNAYDAYAANVELHIFEGQPEVAAIFDDGFGMDRDIFLERWLVIGTESKIEEEDSPAPETFGLPVRWRQGEKGIGRLSAAFLAPVTVVISKRRNSRYAAVMVDWRLFENPFINLEDIRVPVEEFDTPDEALSCLRAMVDVIRSNLGDGSDKRALRLKSGWDRYSKYEQDRGLSGSSTATAVREFWTTLPINQRHLDEWPVFADLVDHGTALFLLGIHPELNVWVRRDSQDEEVQAMKERLRETLTAFVDPYQSPPVQFDYAVLVHQDGRAHSVLSSNDVFGADDLHELEHYIDGEFDEYGVFRGRIVAFGQDLGVKEIVPRRPPPHQSRDRVGQFAFTIGTFEQKPENTTHSEQQLALLFEQADRFGGLKVYRDGLRVMPYGRHDADFFELEERRSKHAGRAYWSHRRSFGRVAFTHRDNPNLRDKAGREGLVENRAKHALKILVMNVLREAADRFFGTESPLRKELLPEIQAKYAAAREAAERARVRRRRNLRQFLKEQREPLRRVLLDARRLAAEAERVRESRDPAAAAVVIAEYRNLSAVKDELRPPPVPAKLTDLEDRYREYRDDYREFVANLDELGKLTASVEAEVGSLDPEQAVRRSFHSHQSTLSARIDSYVKAIDNRTETFRATWRNHAEADRGTYYRLCSPLLQDEITTANLVRYLNLLDVRRRELEDEFALKYEPVLRAVDQLVEGIDLDSALSVSEEDKTHLEEQVRNLQAVAQIGITVEIIGHEFETLDTEVRRNLMRLPDDVRRSSAFKLAFEAQSALTDRLRFLAPLKIAGYRPRQTITGADIANYIDQFFGRVFRNNRIEYYATERFRSLEIVDLPSRIYPVFINLVNNAVYWVSQGVDRRIHLDRVDGKVVIADSGPGVDRDDVPRLFELFFTRRREGRGVGLYLSSVNLAVAGHRIRYASEGDPQVLPGANFIIEFKGVADA
jgi:signal transduction histidine kinase